MHINFDAVYQGSRKFARETRKIQTALIGSVFSDQRNPPFWCADAQFILLRILRFSKYIKNTLNKFMHLVRLMWRSASESKLVHSRYSWLSQAWRTAEPIWIISAVSNWFRRRTSHELNSLNSIRLMWSTASEPGLIELKILNKRAFLTYNKVKLKLNEAKRKLWLYIREM